LYLALATYALTGTVRRNEEEQQMLAKPRSLNGVGIVQTLLASAFVIWLFFFPSSGVNFAWPITPALSAMLIGASFVARAYLGVHLWREKEWWRLRWQVWGNLGFLAVIFVATFWHIDEMNWTTNIIVAHIWVLAYAIEPLMLILIEPRGEEASERLPPTLQEGPIFRGLKLVMGALFIYGIIIWALLFINPEFASTRWPWPLTEFDARIISAFAMLGALWALRVYFFEDWALAKLAVRGLLIYGVSLMVLFVFTVSQYGPTNRESFGIITAIFLVIVAYYYWRQERAAKSPSRSETPEG
jgi:hypothetical protein